MKAHGSLVSSRMLRTHPQIASCVACLVAFSCGIAAGDLVEVLFSHIMPLRRPVQNWMTNLGLGTYAGYYGLLNFYVPHIPLSLLAGAICGFVAPRSWVRVVLCYSAGTIALRWNWHFFIYPITCVVPFVFFAAWASSRWSIQRKHRQEHNLCLKCGYDLRGSSGNCPECGHKGK